MSDYLKYRRDKKLADTPQEPVDMRPFFESVRPMMTGVCQCGCGKPSQKKYDNFFFSICHIFPQNRFDSVRQHKANWVERAFWGGCHTNMDEQGMDNWPNFADWYMIKERFFLLSRLLTKREKAKKFYTTLKTLVKNN